MRFIRIVIVLFIPTALGNRNQKKRLKRSEYQNVGHHENKQ